MLKRELKVNFKNFLIWLVLIIVLFLVIFLIYPSIISGDNAKAMDDMLKIFPKEVLATFNMDISSLDGVFGWFKSEGFVFILLLTGCYAGILGTNILLKEESKKTIEYLNSLPITRNKIVLTKALAGFIYVIALIVGLTIFNYIALTISGDFNVKEFFLLSISTGFSSSVIYFFCLFISTFTHKSKKMLGITLGIVFGSYILYMFSTIAEEAEFLKYLSFFTLADVRNIITDVAINPYMVLITIVMSIVLLTLTLVHYNKKELV